MKPNHDYTNLSNQFWACVKTISEGIGYTEKKKENKGNIKVPTQIEIESLFEKLQLDISIIISNGNITDLGKKLLDYFSFRADILDNYVHPRLMNVSKAKSEFESLYNNLSPNIPIPMNKQKNEKKAPAYFTGIINMLIEENIQEYPCDYDPKILTKFTKQNIPVFTMSRRVDGAFPSPINPIAIWEIKEYYYTTTFGSRVADGVYESLLDGMELAELKSSEDIEVKHYMMIDAYYTWWVKGKSYLCRLVDMLHIGYLDEIFFGYEVIEKLPKEVQSWVKLVEGNNFNNG